MGDFSDFQRGRIVGALLAGASVIKTTALLGVSRAAVSKVMVVSSNRNIGQKPKLSERD
jgi:predicted transcriptional regulator